VLLFLSLPIGALVGGAFMFSLIEAAPQMDTFTALVLLSVGCLAWPLLVAIAGPRITGEKVKTNDSTAWMILLFAATIVLFQAIK
jgi:hypothetical protein